MATGDVKRKLTAIFSADVQGSGQAHTQAGGSVSGIDGCRGNRK